jgi:hypothetical protein
VIAKGLDAPVEQLQCPTRPGGLHPAIATDGTPHLDGRRVTVHVQPIPAEARSSSVRAPISSKTM